MSGILDPIKFVSLCWPDAKLYDKQREIMCSVRDNDETVVPAGNQLGKDWISALIVLWFFCSRRPARVVTTSVKGDQLDDVLWGEIRNFIKTSKYPLPIKYNHMHIRQVYKDGSFVPRSEIVGQVVNKGESLLGRHLPLGPGNTPSTLVVFDEASGISDEVFNSTDTWAHRRLLIGNCYDTTNHFYRASEEGDLWSEDKKRCYRKVIRIKAEDSPNVQYARAEMALGKAPSNRTLIPGLKGWELYQKHRKTWDKVRQCIGLDAQFYKGAQNLLFPTEWLNIAEGYARSLPKRRKGKAMGVDPAEGGDSTSFCIVDEFGIINLQSLKTPDTAEVVGRTIALAKEYDVEPQYVLFDRGGGGKQHADQLRQQGFMCETIGFGEAATPERKRGLKTLKERKLDDEDRYAYKNRRAQMYGTASVLLDTSMDPDDKFGIPDHNDALIELRRQLALMPKKFDQEGRMYLPPKDKRSENSNETTLKEMLGCSPDEADSFVLAVYRLLYQPKKRILGAIA